MDRTVYVECPFCKGMLEADAESGKIVNGWKHDEVPQSAKDKLESALRKIEEGKKKRKDLFESTKGQIDEKRKQAEDLFKKEVNKIKKEGGKVERPASPFDLD